MKWLMIFSLLLSSINGQAGHFDALIQNQIDSLLGELNSSSGDTILYWNAVALQAIANDFDPDLFEQPDQDEGTAGARALAIIHGAMHDAMLIFQRTFPTFTSPLASSGAIIEAAHRTLSFLFPQQRTIFNQVRQAHLERINGSPADKTGLGQAMNIGNAIAERILALRARDGSGKPGYCFANLQPGFHRPDPLHPNQDCQGVFWSEVKPFAMTSASQFRPPNTVGNTTESRLAFLNSAKYRKDLEEVKRLGAKRSANRTADQTELGIFWAYDGAPRIGVSPRRYNQITRAIAIQENNTIEQNARLFAVTNYALADVGIAVWESKYYYNLWRPVVGIRLTVGNDAEADPQWEPLGAPADGRGTDFTPPFPSYVSGHGGFGSALFETLRLFYSHDNITFRVGSDEFNNRTIDSNTGLPRPIAIRTFTSFSHAEAENHESRIALGVHWRIDQEDSQVMGRRVGQFVYDKFIKDPLSFFFE